MLPSLLLLLLLLQLLLVALLNHDDVLQPSNDVDSVAIADHTNLMKLGMACLSWGDTGITNIKVDAKM